MLYLKKILFIIFQKNLNFFFLFVTIFLPKYKKFLKYKKFFKKKEISIAKKDHDLISLTEMFPFNENIISFFFWKCYLERKYKKIIFKCFPTKINYLYNPIIYYIYKKLGFEVINYFLNSDQEKIVQKFFTKIKFNKFDKKNFLEFQYCGVKIGDLIYDHYLRFNSEPTVDFNNKKFHKCFFEGIKITRFWLDYFKSNNVIALMFSHTPYLIGIPARVSLKFNVDTLNVTGNNTFRLRKNYYYYGDQYFNAKKAYERYKKIVSKQELSKFLNKTRLHLDHLRTGKIQRYEYLPVKFYNTFSKKSEEIFKKNHKDLINKNNFNILIATHDFFEGPNTWGKFIFADFYEWIKFLVNFSNRNENKYHWFIKQHPDTQPNQKLILNELLKKSKNIKLLPINTPHSYLTNRIKFVLSARGEIAYEYAYFNIPCLLCSDINLYNNFNFLFKTNSLKEYIKYLKNLNKIKYKLDKSEIIKFHFIREFLFDNSFNNFIIPAQRSLFEGKPFYANQARNQKYSDFVINETFKKINFTKFENILNTMDFFFKDKNQLLMRYPKFSIWY